MRLTLPTSARLAILSVAVTLPTTALAAQSTTPAFATRLDSLITAEMARTKTPGAQVAVVVDGKLAYAKGYGVADIETGRPVTTQTLFRVGSVTKMVAAATLSQLAAEGKLDLQAPIGTYVTEIKGKKVADVSTHQLLTHTAGWLDNAVAYGRMGEGALGEVFREIGDTLFFTAPGRVISYSNPGYSMAGYVAERAGGARFATLTEQLVLRKAGMMHSTFKPLEAMTRDFSQGHAGAPTATGTVVRPFTENTAQWAAGFLFSNTAEFARFTMLLMNGGTLDGSRILAAEAVQRMTSGHQAIPGSTTSKYGYGLTIGMRGTERIWQHGGAINGFDASVTMFPDRKMAVILFDNRSGAPLQGVIDLVAKEVAGLTPPIPPTVPAERVPTAAERAQLVGTFKQGNTSVTLFEENGALKFRQGPGVLPAALA
ncbi:MAG: serine hydrolase, partial [Gemmatimonadaceae bacterium]|nr:serine hydrolase [Gemmatimonadaceae bacterium]